MKLNRVALITGAAGGLGQALVTEFSRQGWQVGAGVHQSPGPIESDSVCPIPLDVTRPKDAEAAVTQILTRWGRLDVLVNNAAIVADRPLGQMSESEWDDVLGVNLTGPFHSTQAALRPMLQQRDGHIINISSFNARAGARGQANYAAAKAGLIGLTQSLAREVGLHNVRVNAVLPGVLPTRMTAALDQEALRRFASANALGRINDLPEVAGFIVFLATLQNVSGQVFQLDSRIVPWA